MVNRFRAKIAGLSIILHPFGIFLRNSILKFFGAYGIFYFRLLCMYEAVWVCHIVLFGCFKSLYNCFGLGEYIGRSLFHYITNYPPMEAFVTGDLLTSWVIRVLQLIAKACRQHVQATNSYKSNLHGAPNNTIVCHSVGMHQIMNMFVIFTSCRPLVTRLLSN